MNKNYKLRYLPVFADDLQEAVDYITIVLNNHTAAERLIDDTEQVILKKLESPEAFSPYVSKKNRQHQYYRINIRNYSVFYVVIDDVMEVRRFIYSKSDIGTLI